MLSVLVILVLAGGGAVAYLLANEGRFIYFPSREHEASPEDYGLRAETLQFSSAGHVNLHGWWIRGAGETALLYFHGNGGNISHRLDRAKILVDRLGLDVFLFDYRGYAPASGVAGTAVTLTGTDFDPSIANDKLRLNTSTAVVSSAVPTTLGSTVPTATASGRFSLALTLPQEMRLAHRTSMSHS